MAPEQATHGQGAGQAVTARVVELLRTQPPKYPFASLQTNFFASSGALMPRAVPGSGDVVRGLIASLTKQVHVIFPDFPDLLVAGLARVTEAAGVPWSREAIFAAVRQLPEPDLVAELTAWRVRLPEPLFRSLCEMNRPDLVLLDGLFRAKQREFDLAKPDIERVEDTLTACSELTGHRVSRRPRPAASAASPGGIVAQTRERQVWMEPDPVIGWRIRPNARFETWLLGNRVVLTTDAAGQRTVVGQPDMAPRTLAIYGCSIACGLGVSDEDVLASVLQRDLPAWRVENHGVPGHGTVHNWLLLQRNMRWTRCEAVTFAYAREHRLRNVADLRWVLLRSGSEAGSWISGPVEATPRAMIDSEGKLTTRPVRLPRADLRDIDLVDFLPDDYYLDLISFRLFVEARNLVRDSGGHFFVTFVGRSMSRLLDAWCADAGIPLVRAILPSDSYTNLPDDHHPNAAGHRFYADRIIEYLHGVAATLDAEAGISEMA